MVMSIIIVIASFAVPAASTVLKGSKLTQGSQMVLDQLGLARQIAIAKNHACEVRFYQFGDAEVPGEAANNPTGGRFHALQLFDIPDNGTAKPLGKIERLPLSISLDAGKTLSTLVGSAGSSGAPLSQTGTQLNVPLPRGVGLSYNAVIFRFLADGSTNLPSSTSGSSPTQWFLTLHDDIAGDKLNAPPANFFTVQIEPSSGKTRTFRP